MRLLPFNRRFARFAQETGLTWDDVERVNFFSDIDWTTRMMRLKDGRLIELSHTAMEIIRDEVYVYGNLWWLP